MSKVYEFVDRRLLRFHENGDPRKVVKLEREKMQFKLGDGQVLIRWLCAPINPLDINIIQGVYAIKRELPAIPGGEAVGRVVRAGPSSNLTTGDLVVPLMMPRPDCWADYSVVEADGLVKVDNRIEPKTAATLIVNPCTAWLMLKTYVDLEKGDWIIQNSANSGVGQAVIQLAWAWGLNTICIIRDHPEHRKRAQELRSMGATHIFSEEEFGKEGKKFLANLEKPVKLALNGVGGRSSLRIAGALCRGGTLVTYGGMSKQAHEFSTAQLVFNDIRVRGIAVGMSLLELDQDLVQRMLKELQELAVTGQLNAPQMDAHAMGDYEVALANSMDGKHRKQMLVFEESLKSKI
ncbi:unnamed protein product, partial [Mesorhabditis spiculigera]